MPKHRKLLIIIADGEHVRFVRPASGNSLHTERALHSISAHKRSAELGTDRPGASFHTGSSAHHVVGLRRDPHAMEKHKFAQLIAGQLNGAAARGEFDDLVIVAPAQVMILIRIDLDPAADARIVGTLQKDLVKTPDNELQPHLAKWVRPVHAARKVKSPSDLNAVGN